MGVVDFVHIFHRMIPMNEHPLSFEANILQSVLTISRIGLLKSGHCPLLYVHTRGSSTNHWVLCISLKPCLSVICTISLPIRHTILFVLLVKVADLECFQLLTRRLCFLTILVPILSLYRYRYLLAILEKKC